MAVPAWRQTAVGAANNMLRTLFSRFLPPLRPLERKLINALVEHLRPGAGALLSKQVDQINLVQRHASEKEVNFYCIKRGKPAFDEKFRFPTKQEVKLATITFKAAGTNLLRANFWLVHGHLFSIEFNQSPKQLHEESIEIKQIELLIDPMTPDDPTQSGKSVNVEPRHRAG